MKEATTAVKPQMTKLEIIDELFTNGYAKDPSTRGVIKKTINKGTQYEREKELCVYRNDKGNRCAVGKCVNNLYIGRIAEFEGDVADLEGHAEEELGTTLDGILFKKYRGHERAFWSALQSFHDVDGNFNDEGLTGYGEGRLEELKEKFA